MDAPFMHYKRYTPNPYRHMEEDEKFRGLILRCLLFLGFLFLTLVFYRDLFYKEIPGTIVSQQAQCSLFIDTNPHNSRGTGGKYYSEWVNCNRIIGYSEWQSCRSNTQDSILKLDCNQIVERIVKNHARVYQRWLVRVRYDSPADGETHEAIVYMRPEIISNDALTTKILAHRLFPRWVLSLGTSYLSDGFWYTRLPLDDLYRGDV
jgi:hypothetical protein